MEIFRAVNSKRFVLMDMQGADAGLQFMGFIGPTGGVLFVVDVREMCIP